jgi:basic membrane protein A and related proteins
MFTARAAAFGALLMSASWVHAADTKPAIVFDMSGKFDKSFNEGVANGAERFKKETGVAYAEFEITNETQFEQAHRRFAQRGHDLIVAVGFNQGVPVETVAKEFPAVHFTIIDAAVKLANVQSVLFKEQEGSFLVGIAAAMASKTGKVGFVGGMDIPLIRRFACGYVQGAKFANPNVEVIQNMTGTTPAAWNDPARGGELAKGQFDRGVDVV